jgi:hypothetical protein
MPKLSKAQLHFTRSTVSEALAAWRAPAGSTATTGTGVALPAGKTYGSPPMPSSSRDR